MEKVFVKSGVVKGDLSCKIYEEINVFSFITSKVWFGKIISPSREIHSSYTLDSCIRDINETFSEAGHETHNMR